MPGAAAAGDAAMVQPSFLQDAGTEPVFRPAGLDAPDLPHLDFAAELEPTTLLGARDSLAWAATNLLDNAAKWSTDGGIVEVAHNSKGGLECS